MIRAGTGRRSASAAPRGAPLRSVNTLRRPTDSAVDLLADLVAMYDEGRREPLPLPAKTSYAWADAVHTHGDPERSAGYSWRSDRYPGEDAEPAHVRTWGEHAWLNVLVRAGLDDYASPAVAADAASDGRMMERLRSAGPAARRAVDDGAGGERGHRQDVRAGRSGHALHRRGRGDAGPDAVDHVQPGGDPGAARPGSAPDRRRGGRFRRSVRGR